jgi:hypothetical protein
MKLELVFISREGETRINEVRELLKNKISFISDGIFSYKNESYSYGLRKSKDNLNVFLSIMPVKETNTDEEAELLNSLKNDIIKGKHRGEYYIVVVYDGSSEYYCYELSKKIASVERKLRQLIYLTVLAVYGKDWVKNTINEEIKNKVAEVSRSKNNHEYIERALEYFTFQDYTDYLFEERMDKSYELLLEEIQFALYYEKEDRNKIQTIIAQGKKRSLWEKLFHPLDVENIKGDIEEIHHLRNIVMHNKAISLDKYVEADILLNKVGNSLDKASELAMEDKYSEEVFVADIISSMKKTFENWDSDRFVKAAKLIESLNLIENRLNNIVNSTNIISKLDFENKLNAISLNSSLAYIAKQNDWLSKIQKLVEPIGGLEVLENIERQNHMFSKLKNHACPTLKNTALDMIEKQNNILSIGTSILPPFFCK